jgi:glycosyltransferase involved in cell wall biosynthesis
MKQPVIGIVIPAYNESRTIGAILRTLPTEIKIKKVAYKIQPIVVNDGSADNTAAIVLKHKKAYLINHLLNCGAGGATRTGLIYARQINCVAAVTMDGDGQHTVKDTLKVAKAVIKDTADFVIGSRLIDAKGMLWYRVLGNKGLSFLTFLLFGVYVTDSQSGMKGLNERALQTMSFRSNNYAFCSEMLWRAKQQKLRIKEVPIKAIYTDYSLAKGQSNWDVVHIIQQLLKSRIMEWIGE